MFQFLAGCLSSSDTSLQVVELAIETLLISASNNESSAHLAGTYSVIEAVKFTRYRDDLPENVMLKAQRLFTKLDIKDSPAFCTRSKTAAQAKQLKHLSEELKQQAKGMQLIALHVHGLDEALDSVPIIDMFKDCRWALELVLIRVRGVSSVVLDVVHQLCTLLVYKTVTPHDIAKAIFEATGLETKLISRNEAGEKVLEPLLETSSNVSADDWPSFLNEDESPVKEKVITQVLKEKTSGWLNLALDFFKKYFY